MLSFSNGPSGNYESDVAIQGIVFHPDGGFDISYAEQRDMHPRGTIVRQLMVPPGVVDTDDILDSLRELLDLALVERQADSTERLSRKV